MGGGAQPGSQGSLTWRPPLEPSSASGLREHPHLTLSSTAGTWGGSNNPLRQGSPPPHHTHKPRFPDQPVSLLEGLGKSCKATPETATRPCAVCTGAGPLFLFLCTQQGIPWTPRCSHCPVPAQSGRGKCAVRGAGWGRSCFRSQTGWRGPPTGSHRAVGRAPDGQVFAEELGDSIPRTTNKPLSEHRLRSMFRNQHKTVSRPAPRWWPCGGG